MNVKYFHSLWWAAEASLAQPRFLHKEYAVYLAVVLSTLLYSVVTWIVYKACAQRLQVYMMCPLLKILNVKWWLHIPNKFILEKSKLPGMYDILTQHNLRWA